MDKGKKIFFALIFLLVVILSLVVYFKSTSKTYDKDAYIFSSIKDAVTQGLSLTCEFNDENGISTKSYIKDGVVKISINVNSDDQMGDIILKDKRMYMWNTKTKLGFIYDIPEETTITNGNSNQSQNYLSFIEKHKDSCKVSTVDSSNFDIPTDVKFQDMTKLLEDLKKQVPQTPQQ